jgi:CRISPR type III-A-associated RAMP protein Csm4
MQQALLVRLRPAGPWRYGPADGALDRVDTLYRSDRLFSAITLAMRQLGMLDAWLDATARAGTSAVAFSSLFPFQGDVLYATPPANLWPPPPTLVNTSSPVFLTKIRWRAAHFVPVSVIDSLMTSQPILADQWLPDTESGCLLRRDRPSSSPFRVAQRSTAAVDRLRLTGDEAPARACVEFETGGGLWIVARFHDQAAFDAWSEPVQAAFKLLADSGFGGGRSKGWGQTQTPEFETGNWPGLILPKVAKAQRNGNGESETPANKLYWLLSLYSPAAADAIDWSGGEYELGVRSGRVESVAAMGTLKKSVRMVLEGCVLSAASEPAGTAVDVAPEGVGHPVYRSGIALALELPPPKLHATEIAVIPEVFGPGAFVPQVVESVKTDVEPEVESVTETVPSEPVAEPSIQEPEAEPASPVEEPETAPEPIPAEEPSEPPVKEPEPEVEEPVSEPPAIEPPVEEPGHEI